MTVESGVILFGPKMILFSLRILTVFRSALVLELLQKRQLVVKMMLKIK